MAFKILKAMGLMLGLWHVAPAPIQAKARVVNFGPYPSAVEPPQDTHASWYDPSVTAKRVDEANRAPGNLAQRTWKESKGDSQVALEALLQARKDPDATQALLAALRELAPQGSEAEAKTLEKERREGAERPILRRPEPLFKAKAGEPGIVRVAHVDQKLMAQRGSQDEGRFDEMLLEDAIKLMAFHGLPRTSEDKKVPTIDGKGKAGPIDPIVRGTLRLAFQVQDPLVQAMASKALGHLGDGETARDLIRSPSKYPAASIADFGKEAVADFKKHRLKQLERGQGSDAAFWQGVRLTPQHMDTALELAMAGDGGAGMAVERNLVLEFAYTKAETSPLSKNVAPTILTEKYNPTRRAQDQKLAGMIDMAIRFPHTKEGFKGKMSIWSRWGHVFGEIEDGGYHPATVEMILRAVDHDLKVIFGENSWDQSRDLVFLDQHYIFVELEHLFALEPARFKDPNSSLSILRAGLRNVFLKNYKNKIVGSGTQTYLPWVLTVAAKHYSLGPIWFSKKDEIKRRPDMYLSGAMYTKEMAFNFFNERRDDWARGDGIHKCLVLGHFDSIEEL